MCISSFWLSYLASNENLSLIWYLIGKKNILRQPNLWRFSIDHPFTEHVKGISESKGRQTCDELKVKLLVSVNVIVMSHISRSMVKRLVNKVFTFNDLNSLLYWGKVGTGLWKFFELNSPLYSDLNWICAPYDWIVGFEWILLQDKGK